MKRGWSMYLHKNRETFRDLILQVADKKDKTPIVVEKDYYITLILRLLSEKLEQCVFKGGTSLSKGFHVIDRFSEDIDITFDEHIGESRRKKLKNEVLKGISEELGMPISNWYNTQSDKDYNAYLFSYSSVFDVEDDRLPQYVKLETALGSYAFPTKIVEINNYIGDYLSERGREDFAEQFLLGRFSMKLQSLERTYIDKVFALCDYYMQNKSKRYSRHLYDIYKLSSIVEFNEDFAELVKEVRKHRAQMPICPSAMSGVNVPDVINQFCDAAFYEKDYQDITSYFAEDYVSYEDVINKMREIATEKYFMENTN